MLVLFELYLLPALGRTPDLQVEATPDALHALSGRFHPGGPDAIYWPEWGGGSLYVTELVQGELVTRLLSEEAAVPKAFADYDGDGRNNLVISVLTEELVDLESGEVVAPYGGYEGAGLGDVNADGLGDYVTESSLWLGDEVGFREGLVFPSPDAPLGRGTHALGDLDGDGLGDLARLDLAAPVGDPVSGGSEGTLDMHLGCEFSAVEWIPHWRYDHPTPNYAAGYLLTAADLDADGADELLVLSGSDSTAGLSVTGELQILDMLLDPSGPTVSISSAIGSHSIFPGFSMQSVGDLDGDGDDEALVVLPGLADGGMVGIIDAEPTEGGLLQVMEPSFELPVPQERFDDEMSHLQTLVGDYDGDGWRDVALVMSWLEEDDTRTGSIAIWLGLSPNDTPAPASDLSHCQPPAVAEPASPDPDEPEPSACLGCATARPPGAWLLALPWLVALRSRRRAQRRLEGTR